MVEVFKTNVSNCDDAKLLVQQIHKHFRGSKANFDLQDCDLILRVQMDNEFLASPIINLLAKHGFYAEVLSDELEFGVKWKR